MYAFCHTPETTLEFECYGKDELRASISLTGKIPLLDPDAEYDIEIKLIQKPKVKQFEYTYK